MPITLASNISAMRVETQLSRTSRALGQTFERLSSGLRINRAADDAAGLSVSSLLGADRRVFAQGVRNLNDGLSFLSVAEGAVGQLSNIVIRQRELAEQAANGIFSGSQRSALNLEAQSLAAEYQRILDTTQFNGQGLLNGDSPFVSVQAGYGTSGNINADILENSVQDVTELQGLGTYTSHVRSLGGIQVLADGAEYLTADFNLDGIDDILAVKASNNGINTITTQVKIFLGEDGTTDFTEDYSATYTSLYSGTLNSADVRAYVSDVGSDGDVDIFIGTQVDATGLVEVTGGQITNQTVQNGSFQMTGFANFSDIPTVGENALVAGAVGDYNNDGILDTTIGGGPSAVISIQNTQSVSIGELVVAEDLSQQTFNLLTQNNALAALDLFEANLAQLNQVTSRIGASQSRVQTAAEVLTTTTENIAAAESQIKDADVALESARLVRLQLLQQASAAILSQANTQPALALTLLGSV